MPANFFASLDSERRTRNTARPLYCNLDPLKLIMNASRNGAANNRFTPLQKKSLLRFKKKIAHEMPNLRIDWAQPYNDTIIEMHLEYDRRTYRKSQRASKLAVEVAEETGVMIIFR